MANVVAVRVCLWGAAAAVSAGCVGTIEMAPGSEGPSPVTGDPATPDEPGAPGDHPPGTSPGISAVPGNLTPATAAAVSRTLDPGRVVAHRLNRVEYDNTVRDLFFGMDLRPAQAFPVDTYAEGFDNNAEELRMSDLLMEKYMDAAARLVQAAFADANVRAKILVCDPARDEAACTARILRTFAERAFRRAVTDGELAPFRALVDVAKSAGDPVTTGVQLALRGMLVAPQFLFRIEPDGAGAMVRVLDDWEIASRLSYFLWSSMPDDELFAKARAGALRDPQEIVRQVRRMMADPRTGALVDNLVGQWLYARRLAEVTPDPTRFPASAFDENLREAMRVEMVQFFREIFSGGRSALDLLRSDFTYANRRLAQHYALPQASAMSTEIKKITVTTDRRGGLLTQAGWLTATSHPDMTSPVKRGKWILTELLCLAAPPPPPGADTLEKVPLTGSLRQRFEQHRANPQCTTCHQLLDPLGFALEHYDAVGRWRDTDGSYRIDTTGALPGTGSPFTGAADMAALLQKDQRFHACMVRKLFTFALGRGLKDSDAAVLTDATSRFAAAGFKMPALAEIVATSPLMTMRRGED